MDVIAERKELIEVLEKNRECHVSNFDKALKVYRKQVIDWLDMALIDARNGGQIQRAVALPQPEVHIEDYDRIITMLKMDTRDEIELTEHEAAQYIMDDWGWAHSFASNTMSYVNP